MKSRRCIPSFAALLIGAVLMITLSAVMSTPAIAEPYIALRLGRPCSACHVNLTGGGMRNAHGVTYGLEDLPWRPASEGDDPDLFKGRVTDRIHLGGDLRAAHESTFAASGDSNEFATREGSLYGDVTLLRERLHLCVDEHVAPGGATSREAFALLDGLPGKTYVKAGRFFPAYGWRLLDDTAFIRANTGFTFASPDDGLEFGWSPGKVGASLSVTNGNGGAAEQDDNKQVTLLAAYTADRFRAGVSGSENRAGDESRRLAGVHAGVRVGPVVILGEADALRSESLTGSPPPGSIDTTVRQWIGYAEADWLVRPGVNLKGVFEYLDPDTSQSGDEVNRAGGGVEFSPIPYTQLRLLWRRTDRPPEVRGIQYEDDRELLLELHLYL